MAGIRYRISLMQRWLLSWSLSLLCSSQGEFDGRWHLDSEGGWLSVILSLFAVGRTQFITSLIGFGNCHHSGLLLKWSREVTLWLKITSSLSMSLGWAYPFNHDYIGLLALGLGSDSSSHTKYSNARLLRIFVLLWYFLIERFR